MPYFVLLAEVLVFYRKVLFGGGYAIPWDLRSFHLPLATFMADSFRAGEFPLWDPFTYCGRPFYANIQAQVFYPPTLLAVLASNLAGAGTLLHALEWQLVMHVFAAGVFTYWLLRRLGAAKWAALTGATVYQMGGFFASQAQHLVVVNAATWLPLAWLSVVALRERFSWRWMAGLAVALAMSVLAGFPAVTVVVVASSLLLALLLSGARLAGVVLLASIWAALLAAVQLLPAFELEGASIAKYRVEWMKTGGGLPVASLMSLVSPNHYGIFDLKTYRAPWDPTYLYIYCGIGGLVLALGALVWRRTRESLVFAVVTLLAGVWMLGDSTPLGRGFFLAMPKAIQNGLHAEFAMAAFCLGMAVLAGLGAQRFLKRAWTGPVVMLAIAMDLIVTGGGRPMNAISVREDPAITRDAFGGSRELLERVRALSRMDTPPSRIDMMNGDMHWAMTAPLTAVPTANGNDPLALERIIQARLAFVKGERWGRYYEIASLDSPAVDLHNIRWVLSRGPLDPAMVERAHFRKYADLPGTVVYENTEVLPRFFLSTPTGRVRVLRYSPASLELETESPVSAFLTASEAYYPGWRAFVDGAPREIALTSVAFRGLDVPAGRHRVRMEFAPRILWWGAAVSLAAWLLAVAPLARGIRGRSTR